MDAVRSSPLLLAVLAACSFQGGLPPGLQCGEDDRCPEGQQCVAGYCSVEGDPEPDADPTTPPDAAPDASEPAARCGTIELVADDFEDGVRAPFWMQWSDSGVTIDERDGALVIDVPMGTATGWAGYTSRYLHDLRDAAFEAHVAETGGRYTVLEVRSHLDVKAQMLVEAGELVAVVLNTADEDRRAAIPYDPTTHRYWRIREAAGTIAWEHSVDRITWNELHAEPAPFDPAHVWGILAGGEQLAAPSTIRFADVNGAAPAGLRYCPASELVDDFDGAEFAPTWDFWNDTGCTTTRADGNLRLSYTGVADAWCGISSAHLFDLRGSAIVIDAGGTPSAPSFITYFQVNPPDGLDSIVELGHNENQLQAVHRDDGITAQQSGVLFDPVAHRYWRIRGDATRVYLETSPDLQAWTKHLDVIPSFDASRVEVMIGAGRYGTTDDAPVVVDVAAVNP